MAEEDRPASKGRRSYDDLDFVEERLQRIFNEHLSETRHLLRTEIAAVGAQVVAGNLQSAREHAEVKGTLHEVQGHVHDLRSWEPRIVELEKIAASAATAHDVRTQMRVWGIGLATLIVGAAGVLAAFLPH